MSQLAIAREPRSPTAELIVGDTRDELRRLSDGTFNCCVTSPPYWGLRDYGHKTQIGAEDTVDAYVASLVQVFREVRRTLRDDGTLWLNIGDSYTSGNRTWRDPDKKNPARGMNYRAPTPKGLKPKDLIGVPWRLAFALQDDGWWLRQDIIWSKPNPMPACCTRCRAWMKSRPMSISPTGSATGKKPSTALSCAWPCWRL